MFCALVSLFLIVKIAAFRMEVVSFRSSLLSYAVSNSRLSGGGSMPVVSNDYAQAFATLVSKGFEEIHVNDTNGIPFHLYPPSTERITKYIVSSQDENVEAWILPKDIMPAWLLCAETKQKQSLFKNILIRRVDEASLGREEETLNMMIAKETSIWIGLPGIGKSMSTMVMLVHALQSIVDRHKNRKPDDDTSFLKEGLDEVFYRVCISNEEVMYHFYWDDSRKSLRGRKVTEASEIRNLLRTYSGNDWNHDWHDALIYELKEAEQDPDLRGFYTSSSREAREVTFKTLGKARAIFFLVEPPTPTELRVMYLTLQHFAAGSVPEHIGSFEKFEDWRKRIGPVPRELFSPKVGNVNIYLEERNASDQNPMKEVIASDIGVFNVGKVFKLFMAPFIRKGVKVPEIGSKTIDGKKIFEFRYLSDECKLIMAKSVKTPNDLYMLQKLDESAAILEATVKYAGAMAPLHWLFESVPEEARMPNWKWYHDCGKRKLTKADQITNSSDIPSYTRCTKMAVFGHNTFQQKVWELEEGTLYVPEGRFLPVTEYLFVNKTNKIVYLHQSTMEVFSKHIFKTKNVDKLMHNLHFDEPEGKEWKVILIGFNDMSLLHPDGMLFMFDSTADNLEPGDDTKTTTASVQNVMKEIEPLCKWKTDARLKKLWPNAERIQATYVVRLKAFDKLPDFILPDAPP